MAASHKRRTVRRSILAVVVSALLLSWYITSWCTICWLGGRGTISGRFRNQLVATVFYPIEYWQRSGYPGSLFLYRLMAWSYLNGRATEYVTWDDVKFAIKAPGAPIVFPPHRAPSH